jgi:hypothetical protein
MKKIIVAGLIVLFTIGCNDDYINRTSLTQIADIDFWQTEEDAFLALNGVYAALQGRSLYSGNLNGWQGIPGFDNLGDNAFNQFKWEGPGIFMEGTMTTDNGPTGAVWNDLYRGIARANLVIENVNELPEGLLEESAKNDILGQALFLRALLYFNVAIYYEDAPLITQLQDLDEAFVPKNSFEEIMAQIKEDLETASNALPNTRPANQFGYATRGAALSLFARVQLYDGVYTGENGVLNLTEQVLGLGYSLYPNYGELFSEAGELSQEIVFSVRYLRDANTSNGEVFSGTFLGSPKADQRPMPNLVNDYYASDGLPINESPLYDSTNPGENRDPRANASIYFNGDIYLTDTEPPRVFTGNSPTGFGQRKYIRQAADSEGNQVFAEGSQDFYVIRYADVLLMRAEALAETGDVSSATSLVNQVRARVNMPSVEDAEGSVGQQAMVQIVRHERRVELAFEGLRFMDLKRWGEVQQAFMRAANDPVGPYNPNYLGGRSEVFPIPQSEIDVNPQLVQHPEW